MKLFASKPQDQVASLGEVALIARIRQWLGDACPPSPAGIGDDCAVLPVIKGRPLVTVDPVVYGVHFNDAVPPRWVGEKLFKRNLSDIAAMGGRPKAAVLALGMESAVATAWLKEFYRGIAAVSRRYHVPIVGGDVTSQPGFSASLTLMGEASPRVLTRRGARLGDRIYITGVLGRTLASGHHYRFEPRLAEGAWLAAKPAVRSLIDVSDGIAKDVHALAPARAGIYVDPEALPLRSGATPSQALTDGEDYELLFSLDQEADQPAFESAWKRKFPKTRLTCIGFFTAPGGRAGRSLSSLHGYEHLR